MADLVLVLLGLLLVAGGLLDATVTTLAAGQGGGPLTRRLGQWVWRGLRSVARSERSPVLAYGGMSVLLVTVLTWVVLTWSGWLLVFAGPDRAVVDATTGAPADLAARVYYAGFVVITLGTGDVVPGSGTWQVLSAVAAFLGLFLVTLSITYLVSVVSAAVARRALARSISLSGETGADLVLLHIEPDGVTSQLSSLTQSIESQILQVTQQHLAYPVLHHFHASARTASAPCSLAVLDDALLLLACGLAPEVRPDRDVLTRLRRALEHYAETVGGDAEAHELPPLPSLAPLREAGLPTVDDATFAREAQAHDERRRRLARLVSADAWSWPVERTA